MIEQMVRYWLAVTSPVLGLLAGCERDEPHVLEKAWQRTYSGTGGAHCGAALRAEDGGYWLSGTTNMRYAPARRGDIYLIRTDAAGRTRWEKTYGGEHYSWGSDMVRTKDGALVIAGQVLSPETTGIDAFLLKVDREGEQLWSRELGGSKDEMVHLVHQAADGGFLIIANVVDPEDAVANSGAAGYAGYDGRGAVCLIRTDRDGHELWRRSYDQGRNEITTSGLLTGDGGALVLSTVMHFPKHDSDLRLIRVDAGGRELWSRRWTKGQRHGSRVIRCADGNYLISGSYTPPGVSDYSKMDMLFIKVDPTGETIWERIQGDPRRTDKASALAATGDGGFIAAGDRTRDLIRRDGHNSLVKIDAEGHVLWRQNWPAVHTMYSALFQHEDGGYVIAGTTSADDVGCMVLIKTKPERLAEKG